MSLSNRFFYSRTRADDLLDDLHESSGREHAHFHEHDGEPMHAHRHTHAGLPTKYNRDLHPHSHLRVQND